MHHTQPSIHTEHYQQTVNTIHNLYLLNDFYECYQLLEPVFLPEPSQEVFENWQDAVSSHPKTLFLDIDETMIHCIDESDPPTMLGEYTLRVELSQNDINNLPIGPEEENPDYLDIHINIRPGLRECLLELK